MSTLIDNFNKLYPAFAVVNISGECIVAEQEATDAGHNFRQLTITGVTGWQFPHELPKKATSFYNKSQTEVPFEEFPCHVIIREDCDGIFCVEKEGKMIFYVCELKSSYNKASIVKAKDQIVGSWFKLLSLLNLLQSFDKSRIEVRGLIVAYEPNTEQLSGLKDLSDRGAKFCISLNNKLKYEMPREHCEKYWHPFACQDIIIQYVAIPHYQKNYTIRFDELV